MNNSPLAKFDKFLVKPVLKEKLIEFFNHYDISMLSWHFKIVTINIFYKKVNILTFFWNADLKGKSIWMHKQSQGLILKSFVIKK